MTEPGIVLRFSFIFPLSLCSLRPERSEAEVRLLSASVGPLKARVCGVCVWSEWSERSLQTPILLSRIFKTGGRVSDEVQEGGRESRVTAEDEEAVREETERDGERTRKLLMLTQHQWCWVLFQAGRKFTVAPLCVCLCRWPTL